MISVISPIYNEAENLGELYERVKEVLGKAGEDFELVLVDNGSNDRSLEIIKGLRKKDASVRFVSLSRNFGHQGAILAGLSHARGEAVISIDGDLQHPPELIPELIRLWKEGHEVVYTVKKESKEIKIRHSLMVRFFYRLIGLISTVSLSYGQSDYRLLDRKVVDVILGIPEKDKFLRGMIQWVGFSQVPVEYEVVPRKRGKSKFSFWNYVSFAFNGIFSFSRIPLRIFLWAGASIASFCGIWGLFYFVMGLINFWAPGKFPLPPGWASIAVSILFLGSVQLIGIGILGEYIGRIYSQAKNRPDFIVREKELE